MTLDPAASEKITSYRPRQAPPEWEQVADQVRMLVAASAHMSPYSVDRLLRATARLAIWCHRQGVPHDTEVWLRHETIDAFVLAGCADLAQRAGHEPDQAVRPTVGHDFPLVGGHADTGSCLIQRKRDDRRWR